MASQLNSSSNVQTIYFQGNWPNAPKDFEKHKTYHFARLGKGVFAPIAPGDLKNYSKYWVMYCYGNTVEQILYRKVEKSGEIKSFPQGRVNLPKGIISILFLMGVSFRRED